MTDYEGTPWVARSECGTTAMVQFGDAKLYTDVFSNEKASHLSSCRTSIRRTHESALFQVDFVYILEVLPPLKKDSVKVIEPIYKKAMKVRAF